MQVKRQDEFPKGFIEQLESIAAELGQASPPRIDYIARVRIERPLFLTLKEICRQRFGYVLHGLTSVHRDALYQYIAGKPCNRDLLNFIRHVFEFRVFLIELSSSNPYVQGDALSRVLVTDSDSVAFLYRQIQALVKEAREILIEQTD
jgi:hypothetical protein